MTRNVVEPSGLREDEQQLLVQKARDREAIESLVQSFIPALQTLSAVPGFERTELINEAVAELPRVLLRYKPARKCKFLTYAWKWFRGAINRFVRRERQRSLLERPSPLVGDMADKRDDRRMQRIEEARRSLGTAIGTDLRPRQRRVVELLFGLNSHKAATRAGVAKMLKISKTTVEKIEQRALRKLAKNQLVRRLESFNGD